MSKTKTFEDTLIRKGDILCKFDFTTKRYSEHELISSKTQCVTSTKTGFEYTSHMNMAVAEKITYDEAVANSTIKWVPSGLLWFYKEGGNTYLAGINHNVFITPTLFSDNNVVTIIKRHSQYTELKEVFDLYVEDKLGIDKNGNLVPYKRGKNKKFTLNLL